MDLARNPDTIRASLPGWLHAVALNRSRLRTRQDAARQQREASVDPDPVERNTTAWSEIYPLPNGVHS